ncbi:MAG: 4Fe-4S binding protein, partial [Saprospiraceae bacterium]|nr:4Fe-4S binding protein [Saprospiraceae bacterium]
MSFANPDLPGYDIIQKISVALGLAGVLVMMLACLDIQNIMTPGYLTSSLLLISVGVILFSWRTFLVKHEGIRNDGIWQRSLTNRGLWGWILGVLVTIFYVLLYWFPALIGLSGNGNTGLVAFFDPLSMLLKGTPASQWFVYGVLYTVAIIIFGIRFIWKYRHNRYQVFRTCSVMFFQLGFAFLIPEFLQKLNYPYNDMKNMWPLNYYFFDEWNIKALLGSGSFGFWMLVLGVLMIFIISPILTYLYGKRWYCSWVCGCGGLAETAGDPFRQLSDKSLKAWQIERWMIHLVLVFSFLMTIGVAYSFFHNNPSGYWLNKTGFLLILSVIILVLVLLSWFIKPFKQNLDTKALQIFTLIMGLAWFAVLINYFTGSGNALFINFYTLRSWYGFLIGAAFSGVIGVGFYPLMGSRVWCRYGCPMAAILGVQQKLFSRFRITTNGGQCISCGNCSTYCEMGIDVRAYAQKGQNIVRASCVGCGICA